jgi:hypothetical protein
MPYIIVVDKSGKLKEINIKEFSETELYKKANFKTAEGFSLQTTWNTNIQNKNYNIALYGKTKGKAGQENKYEFPPPVDSTLFFGGCILVSVQSRTPLSIVSISDIRISEWKQIYDRLMGGFEDIENSDDEEDEYNDIQEEMANISRIGRDGYIRDDFVVEDDEIDYDNISQEEDMDIEDLEDSPIDEEEIIPSKNNKKKMITKSKKIKSDMKESVSKKLATKKIKIADIVDSSNTDTYLDCQSELEEEEYM